MMAAKRMKQKKKFEKRRTNIKPFYEIEIQIYVLLFRNGERKKYHNCGSRDEHTSVGTSRSKAANTK